MRGRQERYVGGRFKFLPHYNCSNPLRILMVHVIPQICEVADICCDGRVVSVLEGGYGRTPPPVPAPPFFGSDSAEEQQEQVKQKLDKTFFSECAIQHLKGLVDPYNAEDEQNSLNRKRP